MKVNKRDYIVLLRWLKKRRDVPYLSTPGGRLDDSPITDLRPIVVAADGEGFIKYGNDFSVHLLIAGEKFLNRWRWRWPRRVGIAAGAVAIAAEVIVSLIVQLGQISN